MGFAFLKPAHVAAIDISRMSQVFLRNAFGMPQPTQIGGENLTQIHSDRSNLSVAYWQQNARLRMIVLFEGPPMSNRRISIWLFVPLCLFAGVVGYFVFGIVAMVFFSESAIGPLGLAGFLVTITGLILHRRRKLPIGRSAHGESFGTYPPLPTEANQTALKSDHGAIWLIVVIVVGVLGGLFYLSPKVIESLATPSLKVVREFPGIHIQNTGSTPVTIIDVVINDRDDCSTFSTAGDLFGMRAGIAKETKNFVGFSKSDLHRIWVWGDFSWDIKDRGESR